MTLNSSNLIPTEEVMLQNRWCFWCDKFIGSGHSVEEYEASLRNLCTFGTVQDFWRCFNNLPAVGQLGIKSSFHMMKEGVKPIWEDPHNASGGCWVMRIRKEDTATVWRELVLAVIGEQFAPILSEDDDIGGVTISIRHNDNIAEVWNKKAQGDTQAIQKKIGELLPEITLRNCFYKPTQDHSAFDSTTAKPK